MRPLTFVLALLAAVCLASAARSPDGPIKYYIAILLENRSYDHMLGFLKVPNQSPQGLTGREYNLWDPTVDTSQKYYVNQLAQDISPDPDHSTSGTTFALYGTSNPAVNATPTMGAFLKSARNTWGDSRAPRMMQCWNPSKLPILSTLAQNFAVFDQWFASVPGPTFGNRMYFHSGTSNGACSNYVPTGGWTQKTLYQLLDEAGYDWAFYHEDLLDSTFFNYTRAPQFADRIKPMYRFYLETANNELPTVSFITPRFVSTANNLANDQHPDHSVVLGEVLIQTIYEHIRKSDAWNSTALLISYDEHGGFYDHYPTPTGIPNPDGKKCGTTFDFTRTGVRVPTILVSPWVNATVVSAPQGYMYDNTSQFEHSSWLATLSRMLDLPGPLTNRSRWAAPFDYLFERDEPRTDTPLKLPLVDLPAVQTYLRAKTDAPEHLQPVNDLQKDYLKIANEMAGLEPEANFDLLETQEDAARYSKTLHENWVTEARRAAKRQI